MSLEEKKDSIEGTSVLITGGLGMIGSTIANKLVDLGAHVTILDAHLPRYGGNFFNIEGINDQVEFLEADIRDSAAVSFAVQEKDMIFQLAAQVDYNYSLEDPFLDLDINCKGHLTVLEACRQHNLDAKIIFSGSRMEYGKIFSNPVTEDHPTVPLSIYGMHKLTGEKYTLGYYSHYGLKCVCFRITNPYGPRSQAKHPYYSILNWFVRLALEDKEITVFGEGGQQRDYIYIDDLAEAMILAAYDERTNGEVYNLGCGDPIKFIDMVQTIVNVADSGSFALKEWPENWHNVETGDFYADISKIKSHINWEPTTSLEKGIKQTVDYYRENSRHYW